MIKARVGNTIILGLEAGNIARLQQGDPVLVKLNEVVPNSNIQVVIVYGDTQQDILAMLERDLGLTVPDIQPVNKRPI